MLNIDKNFYYYINNQDKLVKKYNGKILIINNCSVVGVFDNDLTAIKEAFKKYKPGDFLIHTCGPGKENYTQRQYTRTTFI